MAFDSAARTQVRQVQFRTTPPKVYKADNLTVIQGEFAHDVISVVIRPGDDDPGVFQTGTPVTINWGYENGETETIYGYVHHTEPLAVQGIVRRATLKLVCIGASFVMNDVSHRVWQKRTASSIVRGIIDSQKFSGQIQEHPQIWETLVQDGSDWDFLVNLAQRVGWSLTTHNTEINFRDPLNDFPNQLQSAPLFMAMDTPQPGTAGNWLLRFSAVAGDTTPDGGQKALRIQSGLDPRTGQSYSLMTSSTMFEDNSLGLQTTPPMFSSYEEEITPNIGEAAARLVGKTLANRWYIQAKAEVVGRPGVRPGMLVALRGIGQRHTGYWYVQAAEHELTTEEYILHLSLGRDSDFQRYGTPPVRARKMIPLRTTSYGEMVGETPPTIFVGGRWRAAYSPRQYRAG